MLKTESRFVATMRRHSTGATSTRGFQLKPPTVLTSTSMRPHLARACSTRERASSKAGHVGADREGLAPRLLHVGGDGLGSLRVAAAVHHHPRLLGPGRAREGGAEAAPAAGHEEDPAAEAVVVHLPVTRTISVVVVVPRNTFSIAASLRVRSPSSRAALKISSEPACCETSRRIFSVMGRIS